MDSHAQTGTAHASASGRARVGLTSAASTAKPDLLQPLPQLGGVLETDLGGGQGDLARDRALDGAAAGRLLERRRVQLGDMLEGVLALGKAARGAAALLVRAQ